MKLIKAFKENHKILADKMDKRQKYFDMLLGLYEKYGKVPVEYGHDLHKALEDPRPWRKVIKARVMIFFAAWQSAINQRRRERNI